ncbi:hypothetical protein MIND_00599600 [Mycena indigotica]|uniref:Uncharacterized protein n=1 Tax=Mycena indigotica TaxID=2126181 RepID=A0A8H6SSR8_9AGAR|nr:uncharacterized protein MIND_00599600 [Mycena indigotica]KAF7303702.1 hypothetical protein MIND_00599600 [Mycena indigotica]
MTLHGLLVLLTCLSWATRTLSLGVLLPLYVYPGNNCAAWNSVNSAISTHSSTQWYIIINPDSGPGKPDTLYQNCVAALSPAKNRVTLGYVDTRGNVQRDIDTYASWPSNARPTGIYFDPISPTSGNLNTYTSLVSYARSKGFSFIGLDPGQTVSDSYIALGDLVNTYESSYTSFTPSSLTGALSKQSVNLENAPSSGSYSTVIDQLSSMGVAAVYITNEDDTNQALPSQLNQFVSEVANTGSTSESSGGSGSSPSGSLPGSDPNSSLPPTSPSTVPQPVSSNPVSPSISGINSKDSGTHSTAGNFGTAFSSASTVTSGSHPDSSSGSGANSNSGTSRRHGSSTSAIVGGILGTMVVLLGLILLVMRIRRRKRRLNTTSPESAVLPFTQVGRSNLPPITISEEMTIGQEQSSVGDVIPPSRQWATQHRALDVKTPFSGDADTSTRQPTELTTDSALIRERNSSLSAISIAGTGITVPVYVAQRESLPPPAYDDS